MARLVGSGRLQNGGRLRAAEGRCGCWQLEEGACASLEEVCLRLGLEAGGFAWGGVDGIWSGSRGIVLENRSNHRKETLTNEINITS